MTILVNTTEARGFDGRIISVEPRITVMVETSENVYMQRLEKCRVQWEAAIRHDINSCLVHECGEEHNNNNKE